MQYNPNNIDSTGNVRANRQITDMIIKDIKHQYGGISNITSVVINANGSLIINNMGYAPKFGDSFMNSLGLGIRQEVENGRITGVTNIGQVVDSIMGDNIYSLGIEDQMTCDSVVFQNELGIKNYNYGSLFKQHKSLQVIYLPNEELTRNNPQSANRQGFAGKLSNLFGFGKGERGSSGYVPSPASSSNGPSIIDRMYESKPVRILTGALGWTLGIKAVVVAASVFGPWGLVFGSLAGIGAYREIKNDRNNYSSSNNRKSNNRNSNNRNSGNRNNSNRNNSNRNNNNRNNSNDSW